MVSLAIAYQFATGDFVAQTLHGLVLDYLQVNDPGQAVSITQGAARDEFPIRQNKSGEEFTVRVERVTPAKNTDQGSAPSEAFP